MQRMQPRHATVPDTRGIAVMFLDAAAAVRQEGAWQARTPACEPYGTDGAYCEGKPEP